MFKKLLRKMLFEIMPELYILEKLKEIIEEKKEVKDKDINCQKLILFGNLKDCKILIKPQINPEIVLSKFDLESALSIDGIQHTIKECIFENNPTAIKCKK